VCGWTGFIRVIALGAFGQGLSQQRRTNSMHSLSVQAMPTNTYSGGVQSGLACPLAVKE